jgi:DNA-directed RNA polymerase specialized sigma24 family protein
MRDVAVLHPGDSDLLLEDIVAVAVAKLPSAQREVAELRLCGWRLVDIATGTQRTVGTVKRLWYRARRVLRTALGPYLER